MLTRRASYSSLSAAGWQFATEPGGVYAFRCSRAGVERTATIPTNGGDDLGSHYAPAVQAIARGDYTREEEQK